MEKYGSFPASPTADKQIPFCIVVHEDDELLGNSKEAAWFRALRELPCEEYLDSAAKYYNSLYHFNKAKANKNSTRKKESDRPETKDEARQRLLFDRATMNEERPILHEPTPIPESEVTPIVAVHQIRPGIVPKRAGGKKAKCFFSLLKCFVGASLMGFPSVPENAHLLLNSNLSFARVCGFIPTRNKDRYWAKHVPSLRKLQQFDQIMTDYGIWSKIKIDEVAKNLQNGIIKEENVVVGDTTHYHGYSGYETVTYKDKNNKENRKSQSKPTKNCRCSDRNSCPHEWELTDEGAGTIVKSNKKYIWGHKASIIGLPLQGVPLDAVAVADAATNDGLTFFPHMVRLFKDHPILQLWIEYALFDAACDIPALKREFKEEFGIELKTSMNPRRRKALTDLRQSCMDRLTPFGTLMCAGGFEMDYKGIRSADEKFIYGAPRDVQGKIACMSCEHKPICCPSAKKGRTVQVPFDALPHIDPSDPPMAKRFKAMMTRRPAVERMIKRLKRDLGDDRLTKRGNDSFQACLDKTMAAFHILMRRLE